MRDCVRGRGFGQRGRAQSRGQGGNVAQRVPFILSVPPFLTPGRNFQTNLASMEESFKSVNHTLFGALAALKKKGETRRTIRCHSFWEVPKLLLAFGEGAKPIPGSGG